MTVLSSIFGVSRKRLGPPLIFYARDDRDAVRHDANIPVSIQPRGMPPVAGTVIDISVGGAAIRIHRMNNAATWLFHLDQSNELGLTGLLADPMSCWVVTFDDDVLRVHFPPNRAVRHQLRGLIERLTAS